MEITEAQKLFQTIAEKASEDIDLKESLLANPKAAIENFTGEELNLPEGKNIKVFDQSDATTLYINIPPSSEVEDDLELTEEQLDIISGGGDPGVKLRG